jgi:hypothetical protein
MGDATHNPSDFSSAWEDYKNRLVWFYAVWIGGLFVVFLLAYALTTLLHSDVPFYVLAGCYTVAFIITSLRLSFFRCPRCHLWFFSRLLKKAEIL